MDLNSYHYPPELFSLLKDVIPVLNRSKPDVIIFFKGAGVPYELLNDLDHRVKIDRESINKYEIARIVLERINEGQDKTLGPRREVLKRVVEFEEFSCCWPKDVHKAKSLQSDIRQIVNIKDSFTRIRAEKEKESNEYKRNQETLILQRKNEIKNFELIKKNFYQLFSPTDNPQMRGIEAEAVLNSLFAHYNILLRDSFSIRDNEGVVREQIDGIIEIDGCIYLVELKWKKNPADITDISRHLSRVFGRGTAGGIFISLSGFTSSAIDEVKSSLREAIFVALKMEEIVQVLEQQINLKEFLKERVRIAVIDKNPYLNS